MDVDSDSEQSGSGSYDEEASFSEEEPSYEEGDDSADEDIHNLLAEKLEERAPKEGINDVMALERKLESIRLKIPGFDKQNPAPWSEILTLTTVSPASIQLEDVENDLEREKIFYNQALESTKTGLVKLKKEGIPYQRPTDFFAEMLKTDEHMLKIKNTLLKEKRLIDESTERKKMKASKKFQKQVQAETQQRRKKQQQADSDAIKKWRRDKKKSGNDEDFPEHLLESKPSGKSSASGAESPARGRSGSVGRSPGGRGRSPGGRGRSPAGGRGRSASFGRDKSPGKAGGPSYKEAKGFSKQGFSKPNANKRKFGSPSGPGGKGGFGGGNKSPGKAGGKSFKPPQKKRKR